MFPEPTDFNTLLRDEIFDVYLLQPFLEVSISKY